MLLKSTMLFNPTQKTQYTVLRMTRNADTIYVDHGIKQHQLTQAIAHYKLGDDDALKQFCLQLQQKLVKQN
jgi:hypothetical protein